MEQQLKFCRDCKNHLSEDEILYGTPNEKQGGFCKRLLNSSNATQDLVTGKWKLFYYMDKHVTDARIKELNRGIAKAYSQRYDQSLTKSCGEKGRYWEKKDV